MHTCLHTREVPHPDPGEEAISAYRQWRKRHETGGRIRLIPEQRGAESTDTV